MRTAIRGQALERVRQKRHALYYRYSDPYRNMNSAAGGHMDQDSLLRPESSRDSDLKILVVDDEPAVLQHLCDGLAIFGFSICRASSSSEALTELAKDPCIGVVMTDIRMPGGDGLSLAQEIIATRNSQWPVQVILITGHASLEDATAGLRAGVSDLLRKPFRLAEACDAVSKAMDAVRLQRQALRDAAARARRLAELEESKAELDRKLQDLLNRSSHLGTMSNGIATDDMRALSHALRTPLQAIAGGADMVANAAAKLLGPGIGCLQQGLRDAISAVELVEELHRLDRAADDGPQEEVDVTAMLRAALLEAASKATELRIRKEADSPAGPAVIVSQRAAIGSALSHCLQCAIEWASPGSSLTACTLPVIEDDSRWLTVTILVTLTHEPPTLSQGRLLLDGAEALTKTQETLHFTIARRLMQRIGGTVTSWSEPGRAMAIRVALPA
jgi:FixJ family two-component response regulator